MNYSLLVIGHSCINKTICHWHFIHLLRTNHFLLFLWNCTGGSQQMKILKSNEIPFHFMGYNSWGTCNLNGSWNVLFVSKKIRYLAYNKSMSYQNNDLKKDCSVLCLKATNQPKNLFLLKMLRCLNLCIKLCRPTVHFLQAYRNCTWDLFFQYSFFRFFLYYTLVPVQYGT